MAQLWHQDEDKTMDIVLYMMNDRVWSQLPDLKKTTMEYMTKEQQGKTVMAAIMQGRELIVEGVNSVCWFAWECYLYKLVVNTQNEYILNFKYLPWVSLGRPSAFRLIEMFHSATWTTPIESHVIWQSLSW